ncbi:MAG: hypothetical protein ACLGI5_13270 [Thermoleophilia bacterium]
MRRPSALLPLLAATCWLALLAVPANAAAPAPTGLPSITGNARAGQVLTATTGTFSGTAPITYSRAWQRCDETGAACAPIAGAGAATYTLTGADVGSTIRITVTATNLEGSASATSPATATIAPLAPPLGDPDAPPVISGTVRDGQILSATNGSWTGTTPMTFTRMWRRCDGTGGSCAPLAGAATHTLTSNDVGATIRVEVTAKNADGEGVATSAQTAVVDAAAPVNTVAPALSGAARSGQTLTSSTAGTWSGTVPMTYARQWSRCDTAGAGCTPIPGATGLTYVLGDDDVGHTIRVAVTATNIESSATAASAASATVGPSVPPVNTAAPAISGAPTDGQALSASDGSWSGTPTITTARRWQRCAPLGVDCVDLAATSTALTLTSADVGYAFRTRVTATNPDGSTQAVSALTAVVAPALPSATAAPVISGTAREGQLLSATQGTWKGTPAISYAHSWQRCESGVCSAIDGASAATYRVTAADVGRTLRAVVAATNAAGTASAQSAPTGTVTGGLPVSLAVPELSGTLPRDGELYSATLGTWAGSAPIVHDRQWLRCSATGMSCTPLSGEISAGYRLTAADLGKTVRIEVTATNAHGATKAQSPPSPVILAAPPQAGGDPTIAGTLRDGELLSADSSWSGTAPITLSHQWQRCEAAAATCVDIAGATGQTHRLTSAEVGSRMRVRVGALNAGGGGVAWSVLADAGDADGIVAPSAPHATGAPLLTGAAREGSTLASTGGTFSGTTPLTRSIRWQRCDDGGTGCADIPGATDWEIALSAADRGSTLRAVVTATNPSGSDSIASAPSGVVALAPPVSIVAPSVSPDTELRDGATLVGTAGGWAGSEPMTLAYAWQRCTTATTSVCTVVPGAAASAYMLTTADVGFALRLVVSASNGAGTVSQASAATGVVGTNPPISVTPPTVSGTPRDGGVLTVVDGVWAGPVVVETSYEWWRCDTSGANCTLIAGATGQSLVLGTADIGLTLRARVVRTSAGGTTGAFTLPTSPVLAAPPANVVAPQITGGAAVGKLLSAERGSWTGTPALDFAYRWRRCDADGSACADIDGATDASYRATEQDEGARLRVVVTATNSVGNASAASAATAEIQIDPPLIVDPPQIEAPAGPVAVGAMLTARPGTWRGAQPISFQYAWARCDAALAACSTIPGADTSTYALAAADLGRRIVVRVTATNVVDATTEQSAATTAVLPAPPASVGLPTVTAPGGVRDGAKLVASQGTWTGATPISYAVTWLRCDGAGAGCATVAAATGPNYTLSGDDVGHRIRARVTATNTTAETIAESAATAPVAPAPPLATALPSVVLLSEKVAVGASLRAQTGTWSGTAPLALAVRWQRCPATSTAVCDDVPGATGNEYVATAADVGRRLRIVVTAANAAAAAVVAVSTPTIVVPAVAAPKAGTAQPATAPATSATAKPTATTAAKRKATAKKKKPTAKRKRKASTAKRRPAGRGKPIAAVERLRLTPSGRLRLTLRCPSKSARSCGATGTIVAGTSLGEIVEKTSLRFKVAAVALRAGRTRARSFKLTTRQLAELRELRDVNFRVRLAAPAATKRFRELFVRTRVPAQLRG